MRHRPFLTSLSALLLAALSHAADLPTGAVYELAQVDGVRVGSRVTTTVKSAADAGQWKTTTSLDLTLRRYGALVRLRREEGCIESSDGQVLGVSLRQGVPGGKQLVITGQLNEGRMYVQVDERPKRQLLWARSVVGLREQDRMWAEKKPKTGDKFTFRRYEPTYNTLLTVQVEIKGKESVDILGTRRSLLRVEMTPDKLEAPGIRISPPKQICWLDDTFVPQRQQTELDGLGTLLLTRTSKDKLPAPGAATLDIGSRSLVPLNRVIARPYDSRKITYRLLFKNVESPASLIDQDDHQKVSNIKDDSFDLTVQPVRPGRSDDSAGKAGEEYLTSNHFIDSDDEKIVELARRAIAGERDPWKKALRIERWVKNFMRNDNTAPLVPASRIARSPRGDCRHHAFLTAALCRAAGVPSRTAIGLLYVYRSGPRLGFHTWAEVYIEGQWIGIDSTLGKGGVSAVHVKVTHHSWNKTESMTPLLPVNRILGKLRVEVLHVD